MSVQTNFGKEVQILKETEKPISKEESAFLSSLKSRSRSIDLKQRVSERKRCRV